MRYGAFAAWIVSAHQFSGMLEFMTGLSDIENHIFLAQSLCRREDYLVIGCLIELHWDDNIESCVCYGPELICPQTLMLDESNFAQK